MNTLEAPPEAARRFLLAGVSWRFYETCLTELGDRPVRLTFDRGDLELMAPSFRHEHFGALLGRLIETLTEELNIPIKSGKSTTFKRQDLERGLEPDECYYLQNEARVRAATEIDLRRDPPPDLAIEIDITRSSVDRLGIYAALGVPEVWRYDGETLRVLLLGPTGTYAEGDRSRALPFVPTAELNRFLASSPETDETTLVRSFRRWVREQLAPRFDPTSNT